MSAFLTVTRRYSLLRGLTSSSCGGKKVLLMLFRQKKPFMLLFVHILRHFWCSVIILVTVSSNLSNFGKKISPAKKNKNKKNYIQNLKNSHKKHNTSKKSPNKLSTKKTMYTQQNKKMSKLKKKFHRKKEEQNAILLVLPFEEICLWPALPVSESKRGGGTGEGKWKFLVSNIEVLSYHYTEVLRQQYPILCITKYCRSLQKSLFQNPGGCSQYERQMYTGWI